MFIENMLDTMSNQAYEDRKNYHLTFGELIDALEEAPEDARITPKVVGFDSYRGYYSDIALCTESGASKLSKENMDELNSSLEELEDNEEDFSVDFDQNPKELAEDLRSAIGKYLRGYKGGLYEITEDTPLWLSTDYGHASREAIIEISDYLELKTQEVEL